MHIYKENGVLNPLYCYRLWRSNTGNHRCIECPIGGKQLHKQHLVQVDLCQPQHGQLHAGLEHSKLLYRRSTSRLLQIWLAASYRWERPCFAKFTTSMQEAVAQKQWDTQKCAVILMLQLPLLTHLHGPLSYLKLTTHWRTKVSTCHTASRPVGAL